MVIALMPFSGLLLYIALMPFAGFLVYEGNRDNHIYVPGYCLVIAWKALE